VQSGMAECGIASCFSATVAVIILTQATQDAFELSALAASDGQTGSNRITFCLEQTAFVSLIFQRIS